MNRSLFRSLPLVLLFSGMILLLASSLTSTQASPARQDAPTALLLQMKGAITPAATEYLRRGLQQAEKQQARLLIMQLDTPGGLDAATRDMIALILASPVPVVTWVAPEGARAASAGTYLLYASHVAAMAPNTHLGSATPVSMGGGLPGQETESDQQQKDQDQQTTDETGKRRGSTAMERKVLEDAVSTIRNLAERHGRNADWAEAAVRDAVSLTAREALQQQVIDLLAYNTAELLDQLHGREVVMAEGRRLTLDTGGLLLERLDPDWRTRLLSVISDPSVAYFLLILGFYGLIFEFSNPGSLVPGTLGALCLLLALYAFQVLPVNYAGLALVFLGLILIVAEAFIPSFGILGVGGIAAFVAGSIMLMDSVELAVSLPLIGGTALAAGVFLLWIVTRFTQLRRRRPRTGEEAMTGETCVAMENFEHTGRVRLHGEIWKAVSKVPVQAGQPLKITGLQGLTLQVTLLDSTLEGV
ncbi:NfeD family protein [Marinospirillum alkaliphilum]|uniref:Membrane-bound serine protease (ClpP class) n=1 Tax=Marinospirillum alkaliphilum DSM 21637 TaxID=1122209 RepID=A0A1K1TNA3_9GAMM|nr:nodulation protein NfeD [Marinospirillum alkaliphilum]SFX01781.1 membrane-bound serine protease (ClpP class) [Marinospirillum alkaliphilum DSM 21637]